MEKRTITENQIEELRAYIESNLEPEIRECASYPMIEPECYIKKAKKETPLRTFGVILKNGAGYNGNESLEDILSNLDDSFSVALVKTIDEKGFKDSDVYNRALLSRQVFNNIKNGKVKTPSKGTVCALIFSLKLNMDEANEFLKKAGYALSNSSQFDLIIKYCIEKGIYDVNLVNEYLYSFDQILLGTK